MRFSTLSIFVAVSAAAVAQASEVDFNRDIRPILPENCFACHGPDANKRKAELRLDVKESALGAAESGEKAVVPGDLEKSELTRRVTSSDRDEKMPPPKEHKQLTSVQMELLKKWVKGGAKWTRHWAFEREGAGVAEHPTCSLEPRTSH